MDIHFLMMKMLLVKKNTKNMQKKFISKDKHCLKKEKNHEENLYFSESYLNYLLNNMIGLTPLWCNALLGDIGRHGDGEAYVNWSNNFSQRKCITSVTKTQRIMEIYNDSLKNVFLNKKNDRID